MPPKPKYTKEEIITAAYELAREKGIDAVVAREVGHRLNASSSPIFTVFNSMDELKLEVYHMAKETCVRYMDGLFDYEPAFKEFGMRWVRFAIDEPHLYQLLFQIGNDNMIPEKILTEDFSELCDHVINEVANQFSIGREEAANIFRQMMIYANGVAAFCHAGHRGFSEERISAEFSQVCIGLAISAKLREGTFVEPQAKAMSMAAVHGVQPHKK